MGIDFDTVTQQRCVTAAQHVADKDVAGWVWDSSYRLYFTGISADVVTGARVWYGEHTGRRGGSGHSGDMAIAMAMTMLRSGEAADGRGAVGDQRSIK